MRTAAPPLPGAPPGNLHPAPDPPFADWNVPLSVVLFARRITGRRRGVSRPPRHRHPGGVARTPRRGASAMRPCGFRPYPWARRVRPEPFRVPEAPAFRRPPGECPPFGAQRLRPLAPTWNDQSLRRARTAAHVGEMAPALAPAGRAASLAFGAFHRRPMPEGRRARPPCAGAGHTTGRRRERPAGFFGRPPNAKSGAGPVPATPVLADLSQRSARAASIVGADPPREPAQDSGRMRGAPCTGRVRVREAAHRRGMAGRQTCVLFTVPAAWLGGMGRQTDVK